MSWYCSKECQKKHWPVHKPLCKDTGNATRLLNNLVVNPLINHLLQIAFVCGFNLLGKPIIDKPFIARCDVAVQPSDMTIPLRLKLGKIDRKDITTIEGLLYVKNFIPLDANRAIDENRMELWENMRKANAQQGYGNLPTGLIDFHINDSEQSISSSLTIAHTAMDQVKEGAGFQCEPGIFPKTSLPFSATACIDVINTHIRADKDNQLRLRTQICREEIDKMTTAS